MNPYIKADRAYEVDSRFSESNTVGELTYEVTEAVCAYLRKRKSENGSLKYADYAEAGIAIINSYMELYRRKIAPYEDEKIADASNVDPYKDV